MKIWFYARKAVDKYLHRQHPKFNKGDYVLLKRDSNHLLYAVYNVYESGYALIAVHSGVVMTNLAQEAEITTALEGVDYSL